MPHQVVPESFRSMPNQTPAADRSLDVGIVCALEIEAEPIVRRLNGRRSTAAHRFELEEGSLGGLRVGVVRTGTTAGRLRAAAEALAFVHRPRWVIAAGFAVALSDRVRRGDILLATELVNAEGRRLSIDLRLPAGTSGSPPVCSGTLVSVRPWPRRSREKRALGERTAALAADLQSFALADFCAENKIRFLAVRVITEDLASDTGPESLAIYNPSRSYRTGAALGAFLSGAGRTSRIWKLRGAAKHQADRLAAVLADLVPRLPR